MVEARSPTGSSRLGVPKRCVKSTRAAGRGQDPLLERWRALFLRDDDAPVEPGLLAALDDDETLTGWTRQGCFVGAVGAESTSGRSSRGSLVASSRWCVGVPRMCSEAGRRCRVTRCSPRDPQRAQYRVRSAPSDPWSITPPPNRAPEALLGWIRHSLDELRDAPPQVLVELERSLLRRPERVAWRSAVSPLVEDAYATATDEDEVRRWKRLAGRLRHIRPLRRDCDRLATARRGGVAGARACPRPRTDEPRRRQTASTADLRRVQRRAPIPVPRRACRGHRPHDDGRQRRWRSRSHSRRRGTRQLHTVRQLLGLDLRAGGTRHARSLSRDTPRAR